MFLAVPRLPLDPQANQLTGVDPSTNSSIEPVIAPGNKLQWTISNVNVGDPLPTITYQSQVDIYFISGKLSNIVEASETIPSPIDSHSTEAERTDAWTVEVTSQGDYDVIKLLTTPTDALKELNQPFSFDLTYANTSSDLDISDLQFIEVFPYNGDGPRDPVSEYNGSLEFVSITSSLPGATYLYTDAAPASINLDPCHNTNLKLSDPVPAACSEGAVDGNGDSTAATGETNWYDCSGGFASGPCPIAQADVTGIKMAISDTPALAVGSTRQKFTLTLQPNGNQKDDLYTNNFGSRVDVNDLVAISNDVTVRVIASSLGDRVWLDFNGDGIQDAGEPGIPGVKLNLYDASNTLVGSTYTDANGNYLFEGLVSGDYRTEVDVTTLPSGITQTYDLDGTTSADQISGNLGQNTDVVTWDYGYRGHITFAITAAVWVDTNENGIQDAGEPGMANVPVELIYYGLDGILGTADDITFNLVTDSNGNYNLANLPLGDYQVKPTVDSSYKNTYDLDGNKDGLTKITISKSDTQNLTGNFGYAKKSVIETVTSTVSSVVSGLASTGSSIQALLIAGLSLSVVSTLFLILRKRTSRFQTFSLMLKDRHSWHQKYCALDPYV